MNRPSMLEVQVQAVRADGGHLGVEGDVRSWGGRAVAWCPVGVDVQIGEVAVAQRDQMPVNAEVGLQIRDGPAVTRDVPSAPAVTGPVR